MAKAWNLGPQESKLYSVRNILDLMGRYWQFPNLVEYMDNPLPEAQVLALDSTLARNQLGWIPAWDTERAIQETAEWYRDYYESSESARKITMAQINAWRGGI